MNTSDSSGDGDSSDSGSKESVTPPKRLKKDTKGKETPKGKGKGQKGGKAAAPRAPKDTPTIITRYPKADPKKTT